MPLHLPSLMKNPLEQEIRYLPGIGPRRSEIFKKLGIVTLSDLLKYYPKRYEDRSHFKSIRNLQVGETVSIRGEILAVGLRPAKKFQIFEMEVGDATGILHAVWFNQPYLKKKFKVGEQIILSGKIDLFRKLQMSSPEYEIIEEENSEANTIHTGRITPIYPLTEGISQRIVRFAMRTVLDRHRGDIEDYLPAVIKQKFLFRALGEAVEGIHFPHSFEELEGVRRRLVFDEFFLFELNLLYRLKEDRKNFKAEPISGREDFLAEFVKMIPFTLTEGQIRVIQEIAEDLNEATPMRRLLQGDVGSGKTIVAAFFLILCAKKHRQSALLVPTEILAEQHYRTLKILLDPLGISHGLLIGSLTPNEKAKVKQKISEGAVHVVIGTHALLQEDIRFKSLGLLVIDEQHRFGVRQRAMLAKGPVKPHLLVMTATPIPRTLGLTLYGDLDISTIDELPKGRKPVKTYWIVKEKENEILGYIKSRILEGEQAYILYPVIEGTEKTDLETAVKGYQILKEGMFRSLKIELIHGRISSLEREKIMNRFRVKETDVLVATSLIEVGIDNPNANLMVIENAERFGLSQLHQLRGRIGRGAREAYCFLFGNPNTLEGKRRLRLLTKTTDGFKIAEEDLRLRGPGEFLGTRQSGIPEFKLGDLNRDRELVKLARKEAIGILKKKTGVTFQENKILFERVSVGGLPE